MKKATHILLVDDDEDDRVLFREALSELPHPTKYDEAVDGADALAILQRVKKSLPDFIFLDLNMPKMNGKTLLMAMKNDAELKEIPVIVLTTSTEDNDRQESLQLGAFSFVTKPPTFGDLRRIISSYLFDRT
ncbi:response regulator [Algoriphagus jejuensis]|uniref:Response regulator n=1 Tax=Algoriphagus jejuensis TaxID=419934 RepID=A0ABN1N4F3_9BACT